MKKRISKEDFAVSGELLRDSQNGRSVWLVCDDYCTTGDTIHAVYPNSDAPQKWSFYFPIEDEPDMYLQFARIYEESDFNEAALAFSRKYGLPDGDKTLGHGAYAITVGESLPIKEFRRKVRSAWVALSLYEAAINKDARMARDLITKFRAEKKIHPHYALASRSSSDLTKKSNWLIAALYASGEIALDTSTELCRQTFYFESKSRGDIDVSCLKLSWQFKNLIGVMYLQLLWLISSGGTLKRCDYCKRILSFDAPKPAKRRHRNDKKFCNDACRQAHHRGKKKRQKQ